jgi:hypothetical protein
MKQIRLVATFLLLAGSAALAQSPWITATPAKPAAPAQSSVPSQAVTTVVTPAEPPAADPGEAPAVSPSTIYAGPQTLTIDYPPGKGGEYILVTEGINVTANGSFHPYTPGNIFRMNLPPANFRKPLKMTCAVRGRPATFTALWWYYDSSSARGGGVGIDFPPGDGEITYQFNPSPGSRRMKGHNSVTPAAVERVTALYFTIPMDTEVKSCKVSGTFDQPPG